MNWADPIWLNVLWALPVAAVVLWLEKRRRQGRLLRIGEASNFRHTPRIDTVKVILKSLLVLLGVGLILASIARPRWGFSWEPVRQRNMDLMILLDTSKSMLAEDIKPNRLQRAKWALQDLIQELRGERVGLVAFAGSSFLLCPLTADYAAFRMMLEDAYAGIIPRGGTEISQALRTALRSFDADREGERAILLLTDGEDHAKEDADILKELKKEKVRLFAVGIGTPDGELIPVKDRQGHTDFLTNKEGNVVKTSLNESFLEKLALSTGGSYVRSTAGDSGLEALYEHSLGQSKASEEDDRVMKRYHERFHWLLGPGLLCLFLDAFISPFKRKEEE